MAAWSGTSSESSTLACPAKKAHGLNGGYHDDAHTRVERLSHRAVCYAEHASGLVMRWRVFGEVLTGWFVRGEWGVVCDDAGCWCVGVWVQGADPAKISS